MIAQRTERRLCSGRSFRRWLEPLTPGVALVAAMLVNSFRHPLSMEDAGQFSSGSCGYLRVRQWHAAVGSGSTDLFWTIQRIFHWED
jgi:hypothetical protein